jgi:branched-chain amino acid transport system ATP-binding protein
VRPLLLLQGVSKSFGSVRVIEGVDLHVNEGEILGVVGPNGAGKTTLMNLIGGSSAPDAGRLYLDGIDITRSPAHRRCRLGIARTHQIPQPFEGLTVFENVLVGAQFGSTEVEDASLAALKVLARTSLAGKANHLAGSLTLIQRKQLELGRALATRPRLLLLDEIAGGLTDAEVDEQMVMIRRIREEGTTIVWIEHVVHALVGVVDRLIAMDFGRVLLEGPPADVMASREVQAIYLGIEET